mmetsp:Transcript_20756/g.64124  ORF Transcript_20756/g.64124 Transcript_20756/m.64124 type:complete len:231 (+) Transcript_20756:97-789(+)
MGRKAEEKGRLVVVGGGGGRSSARVGVLGRKKSVEDKCTTEQQQSSSQRGSRESERGPGAGRRQLEGVCVVGDDDGGRGLHVHERAGGGASVVEVAEAVAEGASGGAGRRNFRRSAFDGGEGSGSAARVDGAPVDAVEEGLFREAGIQTVIVAAEARAGVLVEEPREERPRFEAGDREEVGVGVQDGVEEAAAGARGKGRSAGEKLVEETAEGPPIDGAAVRRAEQKFRR